MTDDVGRVGRNRPLRRIAPQWSKVVSGGDYVTDRDALDH